MHLLILSYAEKFLGHRIGGNTLWEVYYVDGDFEDLLAAGLEGENPEDLRMDRVRPFLTVQKGIVSFPCTGSSSFYSLLTACPPLFDADGPLQTSLTVKQCLDQDLRLRIMARDIFDLEYCAKHQCDDWMKWPAVRTDTCFASGGSRLKSHSSSSDLRTSPVN